MNDIFFYCGIDSQNKNNGKRTDWYLIGASSKDLKTMDHEIAHGLYFTNKTYKLRMDTLFNGIPNKVKEKIFKKLIKMGYVDDKKILIDESQAFLSTGLYNGLDTKEIKKYEKDFIKVFKEFKKSD
jgi:fructose-1-phosphate kinase PfkB-like protein